MTPGISAKNARVLNRSALFIMKYPIFLLTVQLAVLSACTVSPVPQTDIDGLASVSRRETLRVMTFNILWQGHDIESQFHDSDFALRKSLVLDVLTGFDADIIGLQEASKEQRKALEPALSAFGMFPSSSQPGDEFILYRLDRFRVIESGRELLRVEPEIAGTNIGVRDFVWVHLHDRRNGKRFYVLNLHLDHRSSERGRQLDGILLGKWIGQRSSADPVIMTGDFNGGPNMPRYLYLTGQRAYIDKDGDAVRMPMPMLDTFTLAKPDETYSGTSNRGFSGRKNTKQIDYIFVPHGTKVIDSTIIYYNVDGSYPSDHFPLLSEFELE